MLTKLTLFLCVVCAIVLVGCSKSDTNSNTTNANANKPVTATTPATTAPVASAGEKIGIPECDEFIANYEACVTGKVPAAAQAQLKTGLEQWRSSWKKLAANPATKATLVSACKQTAEQARASMKAYNCTF
jgi:hypothetical protein